MRVRNSDQDYLTTKSRPSRWFGRWTSGIVVLLTFCLLATVAGTMPAAAIPSVADDQTDSDPLTQSNLPNGVLQGFELGKTFTYEIATYSDAITTSRLEDALSSRERVETTATVELTGLSFNGANHEWMNFRVTGGQITTARVSDITEYSGGKNQWDRMPAQYRSPPLSFDELPSVQFRQGAFGKIVEIRRPAGLTTAESNLIEGLLGEFSFQLGTSTSFSTYENDRYGLNAINYRNLPIVNTGSSFRESSPGRSANRLFPTNNANEWEFESRSSQRFRGVPSTRPDGHWRARHVYLADDGLLLAVSRTDSRRTAEHLPQTGLPGKPVILSDEPMVDLKLRSDTAIGLRSISTTLSSTMAKYQQDALNGTTGRLNLETREAQNEDLWTAAQANVVTNAITRLVAEPRHPDVTRDLVRALRAGPNAAEEIAAVVYANAAADHVDAALRGLIVGADWTMESQEELATIIESPAVADEHKLKIAVSSMTMSQPQPVFVNALVDHALDTKTHPMVLRATGGVLRNADSATRASAISRIESHKASTSGDRRAAVDDAIRNASANTNNNDSARSSRLQLPDFRADFGDDYLTPDGNFGMTWNATIEMLTEDVETVSYRAEAEADLVLFGASDEIVEARFLSDSLNRVHEITDETKDKWYNALDLPGEGGQSGFVYREASIYVEVLGMVLIDRDFEFPCGWGLSGDFLVKEDGDRILEIDRYFWQSAPIFGPFAQVYVEGEIGGAVLLPYEFGLEVCEPGADTLYFDPSVNLSTSASDGAESVPASHIASVAATLSPTVETSGRIEAGLSIFWVIGGGFGLRGPIVEAAVPAMASGSVMWVGEAEAAAVDWTDKGLKFQLCYDIDATADFLDPVELYANAGYVGPDLGQLAESEGLDFLSGVGDWLEDALNWDGVISYDVVEDLVGVGNTDWQNLQADLINSACVPRPPLTPIIIDNTTPEPNNSEVIRSPRNLNGRWVRADILSANQLCIELGYPGGSESFTAFTESFPSLFTEGYVNGSWMGFGPTTDYIASIECAGQLSGAGDVSASAPSFQVDGQAVGSSTPSVDGDQTVTVSFTVTNTSDTVVFFPLDGDSWTNNFPIDEGIAGCSPGASMGDVGVFSDDDDGALSLMLAPGADIVCAQTATIPADAAAQIGVVDFVIRGVDGDGNAVIESGSATFTITGNGSSQDDSGFSLQADVNNRSVQPNGTVRDLTVGDTVSYTLVVQNDTANALSWSAGIAQRNGISNVSALSCNPSTNYALIGNQYSVCTGTFVINSDGYILLSVTGGGETQTFRINLDSDPAPPDAPAGLEITAISANGEEGSLTEPNLIGHGQINEIVLTISNTGGTDLNFSFPGNILFEHTDATYLYDPIECNDARSPASTVIPAGGSIDCVVDVWLYDDASDDLLTVTVQSGNLADTADIELTSNDRPTALIIMGDSFASGEGGRWEGNSPIDTGDSDGTDRAAYVDDALQWRYDTGPIYGNTDAYDPPLIGGGDAPTDNICHRSDIGDESHGGITDIRVNLACSGAVTADVRDDTFLTVYNQNQDRSSQVTRLRDQLRSNDVRMIVLSIGGNDLEFADMIKTCMEAYVLAVGASTPCRETEDAALRARMGQAMANLDATIKNIALAMEEGGDRNYRLVLQGNPSPIPRASEFRYSFVLDRINVGGCPFTDTDATWARDVVTPLIGSNMRAVAEANDIEFMDLGDLLQGREICSQTTAHGPGADAEWARFLNLGIASAGDKEESIHPNAFGQRAVAACIRAVFTSEPGNYKCDNRPGFGPNWINLTPN